MERFLPGHGLAADHKSHAGSDLAGPEIAAGAAAGDPDCRESLDRYAGRLARALAGVINLIDPDAIVLGGGLSAFADLYDEVPQRWGRHIFSDTVATRLVPPRHGDSSGVRGAAWLWPPDERRSPHSCAAIAPPSPRSTPRPSARPTPRPPASP